MCFDFSALQPRSGGDFLFALHLLRMQGFYFCPAAIQPHISVYSGLSSVDAIYKAKTKNRSLGFAWAFPLICPIPAHNNTADTQAAYTPPAPRWRAYRQAQHLQHIPDTTATPDAVQGCAATYYNKVYKGAAVRTCYRSISSGAAHRRPCQPGGLRSGTGQQSGRTLHPVGQSSDKSTAGGAEPLAATAASLFGLSPDSQ